MRIFLCLILFTTAAYFSSSIMHMAWNHHGMFLPGHAGEGCLYCAHFCQNTVDLFSVGTVKPDWAWQALTPLPTISDYAIVPLRKFARGPPC